MSKELDAVEAVYPKLVVCENGMLSKRPPEMETLARVPHYVVRLARNDGFDSYTAPAYLAEHVDAAIRSLRVKLFRERAKLYQYMYRQEACLAKRGSGYGKMLRYQRASLRFTHIADAIERGER